MVFSLSSSQWQSSTPSPTSHLSHRATQDPILCTQSEQQPLTAQISETNRQFLVSELEYRLYRHTEMALKKLILQAVPRTFTKILCDNELGYATVTSLELMNHLEALYGKVTEQELERNRKTLYEAWDITKPIEDVFTQLHECMAFALAHDPITEPTAIRAGLEIFAKTGHFALNIQTWEAKLLVDKTLLNFRDHFTEADDQRKRSMTSTTAGYHHAASAQNKPPTANIVSDIPQFYCWSHGLGLNSNHTSRTCIRKADGHRDEATLGNMLGGNFTIQRKRNEPQVFVRNVRARTTPSAASVISTPTVSSAASQQSTPSHITMTPLIM